MAIFRVMTYQINNARDRYGRLCPELYARVIRSQQPDLVMLQQLGSAIGPDSLQRLAEQTGLTAYGPDAEGGCAFLSRHRLGFVRSVPLGYGQQVVMADMTLGSEQVHLFNLELSLRPWYKSEQVERLFSEQLLGNPALSCATVVGGDFGLPFFNQSQKHPGSILKRSRYPFWGLTWPVKCPLLMRDRIFFQGPVRALDGHVVRTEEARAASFHLPLVVTVETGDSRQTLKVDRKAKLAAKQATPLCG